MINMLFSMPTLGTDFCYDEIKKYFLKDMNVLVIPLSFSNNVKNIDDWNNLYQPNKGKYYYDVITPFIKYGINESNIKWVNYFNTDTNNIINDIKKSDIIYFTGGLPTKTVERLEELNIISTIKEYQGIIVGVSAGAMIQLSRYHISPDNDYEDYLVMDGIGLIDNFNIEVHFDNSRTQLDAIDKALKDINKPIYAIGDKGVVIVKSKEITTIGEVIKYDIY